MNKSAKNQFLAILLSFLIILAGGAIWGLVSYVGIFSLWVPILSTYCAILVYSVFKKNFKIWTFLYVLILSLVINILAFWLACTFVAAHERPDLSFGVLFKWVAEIILEAGLRDLILCIIFTVFGCLAGYVSVISMRNTKMALEDYQRKTGVDPKTLSVKERRKIVGEYVRDMRKNKKVEPKENVAAPVKIEKPVAEEKKQTYSYEEALNKVVELIRLKVKLTKDELLIKINEYKSNTLSKLSIEEKQQILNQAQVQLTDPEKEKARKILLKLI